jgi:hypothetical protein
MLGSGHADRYYNDGSLHIGRPSASKPEPIMLSVRRSVILVLIASATKGPGEKRLQL